MSSLEEFSKENYIEVLREKSVYFILEPKGKLNLSTVSVADVVNFLSLFTKSYLTYIIFEFQSTFPHLVSDDTNFQGSIDELKARLLPRISDNKFGSFEVGLGVDDLNPIDKGDDTFFKWQRKALESYKSEVFELNFEALTESSDVVNKYPLDIRRGIFNPIYTISNSQRYTVKTTNRLRTYVDELPPITRETKKIITRSEDDTPDTEPEQLEFMTVTVTAPKGGDFTDLGIKQLKKNLVAITRSDTTDVPRQQSFTLKGKSFNAIDILPLRRAIKGLIHILICDVFSIEVDAYNDVEIYDKLEQEIYNYYITKVH